MSTRRWLRMSWWNAGLAVVMLVAAVAMAVAGRWVVAAVFAVVMLVIAGSAIYARSGRASDLTRLNAAEYVDERDRAVATQAFALVGVVALVLALVVTLIGAAVLEADSPMFVVVWAQFIALVLTWAVANAIALRRS